MLSRPIHHANDHDHADDYPGRVIEPFLHKLHRRRDARSAPLDRREEKADQKTGGFYGEVEKPKPTGIIDKAGRSGEHPRGKGRHVE